MKQKKYFITSFEMKIANNKYLNAAFLLMLFSAAAHMLILFFLSLSRRDLYIINYFNIIDFDILFPGIFMDNLWNNLASLIFAFILYFIILKSNTTKQNP